MVVKHPLLAKAQKYQRHTAGLAPKSCQYDESVGAWRKKDTGKLWASCPDPDDPDKPRTKKADIETGEDQKGE